MMMLQSVRITGRLAALLLMLGALLAPATHAQDPATAETAAADAESTLTQGLEPGTYAVFHTNLGDFVAQLFTEQAPITTANFIGLAEGTKPFLNPATNAQETKPFYDNLIFHRVIKGFMLQGGDPEGTGRGGPGFRIPDEFHPELRHDKPGLLSMANAGPNTGGSQFFVTVAPTPHLDNKHAIFGEVIRGMDVVYEIAEVPTGAEDRPVENVVMQQVRIIRVPAEGAAEDTATTATATVQP